MEPLGGERIVLEPLRAEHAERLRGMRRSPGVSRWWDPGSEGWPLEEEEATEQLVITVGGELAGFIQFEEERDPDYRSVDVDIFLGDEHQGQGLGTDAMRTIVTYLTQDRGHHRVTLSTSPENTRAIRAYEKVGFEPVGITRLSQRNHLTGKFDDELLMDLVVEPDV